MLVETVNHFVSIGNKVYAVFFGVSKVIDRVCCKKLFRIIERRGMNRLYKRFAKYYINVLSSENNIIKYAWWRHQMETFSALLALCAGNSPVPVNSPYKGQWRGALMFSLICVWINDWVNNREAGDLTRYRAHYDVMVMNTKMPGNAVDHNYLTSTDLVVNVTTSGMRNCHRKPPLFKNCGARWTVLCGICKPGYWRYHWPFVLML